MKMKILRVIMAAAVSLALLSGCGPKEDAEYIERQMPAITEAAEKAKEADMFWNEFFHGLCGKDPQIISRDINPYPDVPGYYLVTDYDSIERIKDKGRQLYTEIALDVFFFEREDDPRYFADAPELVGMPYLIEVEGNVYCLLAKGDRLFEPVYEYDIDTVGLAATAGQFTTCMVDIDYYRTGKPDQRKRCSLCLDKEGDKWLYSRPPFLSDEQPGLRVS